MTTSKVLPIIPNTIGEVSNVPASFSGSLMKIIESGTDATTSALADWLDLATQIENENGTNQVARRMEYSAKQDCQLWHNQLIGNRPMWARDEKGKLARDKHGNLIFLEASPADLKSQNVRFSARENLSYWETRLGAYTDENGQVTLTTIGEAGEVTTAPVSADDMTYASVQVRAMEARLWYNYVHSKFTAAVALYECLTGVPFEYQPFAERAVSAAPKNVLALAASIRHKAQPQSE